jgi:hypothetical protein
MPRLPIQLRKDLCFENEHLLGNRIQGSKLTEMKNEVTMEGLSLFGIGGGFK